jgi:lipase chaperone LimK
MQRTYQMLSLLFAAVIVAGIGNALLEDKQETVVTSPREPVLFGFVKPLPATSAASSAPAHSSAPPGQSESAGMPVLPALGKASLSNVRRGQHEWRSLFDRVIALRKDRPIAELRQQVSEELAQRHGASAATDGLVAFERYLRYRETVEPLQMRIDAARDVNELREGFAAVKAARLKEFSAEETAALFPHEDAYEQAMLARMEALGASANDEERHSRLQAWEATVPPEIRIVEELRSGVVRLPPSHAVPAEDVGDREAR